MALTGTELVNVTPLTPGGRPAATPEQTNTQAIANLAPSGPAVNAILVESGAAKKISALTAAGALVGTETLAIVQAGATVKETVNAIAAFVLTGGATGTFTSADSKTVTVTNGLITSIV